MTTAIVVGGGISGMLSALISAQQYDEVLLVEKAPRLGGLLRTAHTEDSLAFDFGTHFAATTGNPDMDELLFDFVGEQDWHEFEYLRAGNFFNGTLNESGAFIDVRTLPRDRYLVGLEQLLLAPGSEHPRNLGEQLPATYGQTFTEDVFAPVLHKLYGVGPEQLAPDSHLLFGMKRLMLLSDGASRELKHSGVYDECIAFHDPAQGVNGARVFYPRSGGIGRWVDGLERKLQAAGVRILTGRSVTSVQHAGGHVNAVRLDNGEHSRCDRLIWTIPPFLLAAAAGIEVPPSRPKLRATSVFHFVFDRPFRTDLHYLYVYDPGVSTFRVTLYPNVAGAGYDGAAGYHCTAEVLSNGAETDAFLAARARQDLYAMGLVDPRAACRQAGGERLAAGFPVLSSEFVASARAQARAVSGQFDNLHILGKAAGAGFFMNDVLDTTYRALARAA